MTDNQQRARHPALVRHEMRRAREVLDGISPYLRWTRQDVERIAAALAAARIKGYDQAIADRENNA